MTTSNPTLRADTFTGEPLTGTEGAMTIRGTATKTMILLALAVVSGSYTWSHAMGGAGMALGMIGAFGGFIVAMILCFKHTWAPVLAPVYAVMEGLLLGGISAVFSVRYGGIVFQAVALTFGTLFALLAAYQSGFIRATDKLKMGIFAATGGIAVVYLLSMVLGFFHVQIPGIFGSGPVGIGFSAVVVVIAALNLVLDFDVIQRGAQSGAPKYMEWYGAFGLMVTLVWLYLEILRLLAKLKDER
jgi:uncharacterized YccA/Bax inhibitor family protein